MRDAGTIRQTLADLFAVELPNKIPLLREAWGISEVELPAMQRIVSGEPVDNAVTGEAATWLLVQSPRLLRVVPVDIDLAGRRVFQSRYSCTLEIWARATEWDLAKGIRDRLALACRSCLLEWPNMVPGTYGDTGYRLHGNTYTEQFGTPLRLGSPARVIAPAILAIDVDIEETLADGSTRLPIGDAHTLDTSGSVVGPTAPFPSSP